MPTVVIKVIGNGQIKSSGGSNTLAVRDSITVPSGYDVYFEGDPAVGEKFVKFVAADGTTSTQNPITLPVTVDGSITGYFTGRNCNKLGPVSTILCKLGLPFIKNPYI
jgi:hypothetical protein